MALDTFNPYLFVSAGEQSNKFLTPTYADGIAQFQAQRAQELTGLTVRIDPIQEGTGDPSQTNVRAIRGRTGMTVAHSGTNLLDGISWTSGVISANGVISTSATSEFQYSGLISVESGETYKFVYYNYVGTNSRIHGYDASGTWVEQIGVFTGSGSHADTITIPSGITQIRISTGKPYRTNLGLLSIASETTTIPITWESSAGTVYGGTLDVASGVLTVDWGYIASYDGETLPGEWISDRDVYAEGTTPTTGAEVAYKLAEPVTYQLDPEEIVTLPGFNQIYSDAGPVIDIQF